MDKSKRTFCKKYLFRQIQKTVEGFGEGFKEAQQRLTFDDFFESYESSYALTLAYPDDILIETARQHGIHTEGRGKNEIIKELFEKHGGYGN
ncbi:hypothetical protein [Desulfosarcina sp.]|uniref:hypothetical protein n=1 Tax=Desulfosarcina sp. TaxID=2027861 RepID=UPI0035697293